MSAQNEDDPEGFLLAEIRKILGENIPIVVSLDLHGILTDRMLQHSDAVVVYQTYPHVDFFETGERAARLLLRILSREVKPVTAKVAIPALVRGDELITETGLFGKAFMAARAIESSDGGLSAGMFIGNPFTDVPDLCSNSLVVANDDPERAEREAIKLATDFWQVRERLQSSLTSLEESIRIAFETRGTVILVDAADAPSSGASGDSNAIFSELVEKGYPGKALNPYCRSSGSQGSFQRRRRQHRLCRYRWGPGSKQISTDSGIRLCELALGWTFSKRVARRGMVFRTHSSLEGWLFHAGGYEPACKPVRPCALLISWSGPIAI